ncbi:hypothetical protein LCGC14_2521820 [marine sediment metagenome]|uniref:Uncharacterized protein n=1 Tax=marine sediment metagenome TaxID=412755 RepID=A0A0F9DPI7_9ZZZZ
MGKKTYTKLDENNVAIIEISESRGIMNKADLIKQKAELEAKYLANIKVIDDALAVFTTK